MLYGSPVRRAPGAVSPDAVAAAAALIRQHTPGGTASGTGAEDAAWSPDVGNASLTSPLEARSFQARGGGADGRGVAGVGRTAYSYFSAPSPLNLPPIATGQGAGAGAVGAVSPLLPVAGAYFPEVTPLAYSPDR